MVDGDGVSLHRGPINRSLVVQMNKTEIDRNTDNWSIIDTLIEHIKQYSTLQHIKNK